MMLNITATALALDEAQRRTVDALAWLDIPGSGAGMVAGASSGTGR